MSLFGVLFISALLSMATGIPLIAGCGRKGAVPLVFVWLMIMPWVLTRVFTEPSYRVMAELKSERAIDGTNFVRYNKKFYELDKDVPSNSPIIARKEIPFFFLVFNEKVEFVRGEE